MFKSAQRIYRALVTPGNSQNLGVPSINAYPGTRYKSGENADPASDLLGVVWTRDAMTPAPFNDAAFSTVSAERYPVRSVWQINRATNLVYIGLYETDNRYYPCFLYQLHVTGGGTDAWQTTPTYVQIHWPTTQTPPLAPSPPAAGAAPQLCFPLPREPSFLNVQWPAYGPIYSANASNNGGITLVLSSTRDTYTAMAGATATFQTQWAYMGEPVALT